MPARKVWFELQIKKLDEISTKYQFLKVKGIVKMTWFDPYLRWDIRKYFNVSYVHYMSNEIWTPDILLINNDDDDREKKVKPNNRLLVLHSGLVYWKCPENLISSCSLDVTKWPMDTQECTLTFGSSVYNQKRLEIIGYNNTRKPIISSGEWSVKSVQMYQDVFDYGDEVNYSSINYKLTLDRKPTYTLFFLSPPTLILVFLTFMSFVIPSESGERISFVTTILLTMMVFQLILPEYLPRTSDGLPLLGIMLMGAMVIIAIVLIATIVIVKVYHCTGVPPSWIQKGFCSSNFLERFSISNLPYSLIRLKKNPKKVAVLPNSVPPNSTSSGAISPEPFKTNLAEEFKTITWQELSNKLNWFLFALFLCILMVTCAFVYYLR